MKTIKIIIMLFVASAINTSPTGLTKNNKTKGIKTLVFTGNFPEKQLFNKQLLRIILNQAFKGEPIQKIYNCSECPSIFKSKEELVDHKTCHFNNQEKNYYSFDLDIDESSDSATDSDFDDQMLIELTNRSNNFTLDYQDSVSLNQKLYSIIEQNQYLERELGIYSLEKEDLEFKFTKTSSKQSKKTKSKIHKCDHAGCNYATAQSGHLKEHKRKHTGEKPFKCDHAGCNYATAKSGHLKEHKRKHTGEKPFKCDHAGCSYATAHSGHLTIHKRKHTGEKPHKCDHAGCNYATASSEALNRHKRKHTGEKPFKCDYAGCDYATSRSEVLKRHKRNHK